MNDQKYNLQFQKLCSKLAIGDIVIEPKELSGGLLHKMYAIETTLGKYAIKALNPQIMTRPEAMDNFIKSEKIANFVSKDIPALPAKNFDNNFIQEIDNKFYLLFDWVDGKILKANEITTFHCRTIGAILADIHRMNFSDLSIVNNWCEDVELIDWKYLLKKGQQNNMEWVDLLLKIIDKLYKWNAQANESEMLLSSQMLISHRDLDPKNVMWNQHNPIVIDWEAAGYIDPMKEVIETAIYWSENEVGSVEKKRFIAFIDGYKKRNGKLLGNWRIVLLNGFKGKLEWLEYNLRRSLWIECTDKEEQKLGTTQVIETINSLLRYEVMISQLEKWLINEASFNENR